MYNPQSVKECDIEKKRRPAQAGKPRKIIDGIMTLIGGVASVSSIPQVVKIWQTGEVAGISLTTQMLALFAVASWFLYGLYIKNKPLAITSGMTTIILAIVVIQIFVYS